MNVLITGGAGFIGSHLAEKLLAENLAKRVICVDDLSTGSLDNISALSNEPRFRFVRGDVRDYSLMSPLMGQVDAVFHLAAAVGVQLIVDRPVHTIETNIHGSEVVLDLASRFGCRVLLASTSEVYGKSDKGSFSEGDDVIFGPTKFSRWCYACSKMVDEFLALAHHQQFGLEVIICRLFNTIGPRQSGQYGMVVPRFVQAALKGEDIVVYGDGSQSRCFCNVSNVTDAMLGLINEPAAAGEVINIGASESISIVELAKLIIDMTASKSKIKFISYEQAYGRPFDDMMQRKPNLDKVKRLIGYKPKIDFRTTLEQIIAYQGEQLEN